MDKQLSVHGPRTFEELKQGNEHGAEYWNARDLQPMLGYSQWRRFEDAVKRAMTSCETSGNNPGHQFAGAGKLVDLGSGSQRQVEGSFFSSMPLSKSAMFSVPSFLFTSVALRPLTSTRCTCTCFDSSGITATATRAEMRQTVEIIRQRDVCMKSAVRSRRVKGCEMNPKTRRWNGLRTALACVN